jgi:AraC family transcriptional regulator of adaptative response/methylated-DNA-[protein]-cysteine methyltransferase
VVFFQTVDEALMHGYRPCKVCKPITNADETPTYIAKLVSQLNNEPYLQLKDRDLVERGIEPHKIRRWFLKHHGITFHAFRRMLRINTAFRQISAGCGITDAAFDTGHNSLSGFNTGFQQVFGKPPSKAKSTVVIDIARFTTPLGPMFACASKTGLCLLEFTNRRMLEREFKDLAKRMNAVILPGKILFSNRYNIRSVNTSMVIDKHFRFHSTLREVNFSRKCGKAYMISLMAPLQPTKNKPAHSATKLL